MSQALKDIISIPQCSALTLVSGKNGLDRKVKWTVSLEICDIDFIHKGELVFVTGVATPTEEQLLLLTHRSYERQAAGIVFAPGPYIQQIPQSVIDFGNEHSFPIFRMPWKVRISSITYAIANYLLANDNKSRQMQEIIKSILLKTEPLPLAAEVKSHLHYYTFSSRAPYRIILFRVVPKEKLPTANPEDELAMLAPIYEDLTGAVSQLWTDIMPVQLPISVAFLLANNSANAVIKYDSLNHLQEIVRQTQDKFKNFSIRIGIGNQYPKIEDIAASYQEALWVTEVLSSNLQNQKGLYRYDQLGAYRIICENKNVESMEQFYREIFGPLGANDDPAKNDLIRFLHDYFDHNGHVGYMSKNLFLHRNTILYKIKKIEKILNCSFAKLDDLLNLRLALMIHEVLSERNTTAQ